MLVYSNIVAKYNKVLPKAGGLSISTNLLFITAIII